MRRRDVTADVHLIIEVTEPPLRHRDRCPREVADAASSLIHAGANQKNIDQAGKSEKLKHLRLRCGQQQLTPGDSGLLTPLHQRRRESLTQRLNARTSMKTTLNTHHCLPWGPTGQREGRTGASVP